MQGLVFPAGHPAVVRPPCAGYAFAEVDSLVVGTANITEAAARARDVRDDADPLFAGLQKEILGDSTLQLSFSASDCSLGGAGGYSGLRQAGGRRLR